MNWLSGLFRRGREKRHDADREAAQRAVAEARRGLASTRGQWQEINRLTTSLAGITQRNHFSEAMESLAREMSQRGVK